ncbi:hypothetical protein RND81_11G129900 [Saponaria officinalis]|uniref:F-box associated beta-propeller type 3 domain-containing protein n=1 Tax=Saponaria officinalis TaxID=3572 RepID=A0AAW1HLE0_SAPOF
MEIAVKKNYDIPNDVMFTKLLPRFPAKSLLRFKSVSKEWNATISSLAFAKTRLEIGHTFTQFLLLSINEQAEVDESSIRSLSYDETGVIELRNMNCVHLGPHEACPYLTGSVNGIVCLSIFNTDFFGIWNPLTQQYQQLFHCAEMKGNEDWALKTDGFGYKSSTEDFSIFTVFIQLQSLASPLFYLFSFNSGLWKTVNVEGGNVFADSIGRSSTAFYVNERLYWPRRHRKTGFIIGLFCFDLNSEEMMKIFVTPTFRQFRYVEVNDIFEMGGNLSIACSKQEKTCHVWVLKVEADDSSPWVKVYDFNFTDLELYSFTNTGRYLARHQNQFKLLDVTQQGLDRSTQTGLGDAGDIRQSHLYVPSFITFRIKNHN